MKTKKRISPFAKLTREIEGYLADIVYQSQLNILNNVEVNDSFVLGQVSALRYILERAYAISYDRSIGIELLDLSPAKFLEYFHEATNMREP